MRGSLRRAIRFPETGGLKATMGMGSQVETLGLDNLGSEVGRGGRRQFPTAEVNREMHLPHGSDWSSIREAGRKPGTAGTRPAGSRERVATGSASERPPTHR